MCRKDFSDSFEFLEHTADTYVAAYGRDLKEAFENSALAVFEVITCTENVKSSNCEIMEVDGIDKKNLLYNWIEELIVRFELEGFLYSKFEIKYIKKIGSGYRLTARILGEKFDPARHTQKIGIKSITYHKMQIEENEKKTIIKFILDT